MVRFCGFAVWSVRVQGVQVRVQGLGFRVLGFRVFRFGVLGSRGSGFRLESGKPREPNTP